MKKYKFCSSTLAKVLLVLVFVLCTVGAVWNVINLINLAHKGVINIILYSISILLAVLLNVFVVVVFFFSGYTIDEKNLTISLGFNKSKTPLEEIVAITLFKKSNKLVLYFADQKYTVVVIKPSEYESFVLEIRAKNNKIIYNSQIDGEDTPQ